MPPDTVHTMLEPTQRPPINEVVFADDFFRVQENGMVASWQNRRFLRGLFGSTAARLGWRVREAMPRSLDGEIPVADIMTALHLPASPQGWAGVCIADLEPAAEYLNSLALTPATLVIGWSMPPSILRFIDARGAAFIDAELHSVRFARDLYLSLRTNDRGIQRELERLRIDDEIFWAAAASLRAHYLRRGVASVVRPDLRIGVFAGQMDIDLALVRDGQLVRPVDHLDTIAKWAREVDVLALCPHPAQRGTDQLHPLFDSIPNAILVSGNTYSLLCADNLAFVGALSSGMLNEARYLGHDIRRLMLDDRNTAARLPASCSPWIPVRLEVAALQTMAAFSKARRGKLDASADLPAALFPPDLIATSFNYRWGLNPTAEGLPTFPTLHLGQTLDFGTDNPGAVSVKFGGGWQAPEAWGAWSIATRASVVVRLDPAEIQAHASDGLTLSLHGHMYSPEGITPPTARIRVNGRPCELDTDSDGGPMWRIRLDAEALAGNLLDIAIEVIGAPRQGDIGGHPHDDRRIGLGLRYLALREIEQTAAAGTLEDTGFVSDESAAQ